MTQIKFNADFLNRQIVLISLSQNIIDVFWCVVGVEFRRCIWATRVLHTHSCSFRGGLTGGWGSIHFPLIAFNSLPSSPTLVSAQSSLSPNNLTTVQPAQASGVRTLKSSLSITIDPGVIWVVVTSSSSSQWSGYSKIGTTRIYLNNDTPIINPVVTHNNYYSLCCPLSATHAYHSSSFTCNGCCSGCGSNRLTVVSDRKQALDVSGPNDSIYLRGTRGSTRLGSRNSPHLA